MCAIIYIIMFNFKKVLKRSLRKKHRNPKAKSLLYLSNKELARGFVNAKLIKLNSYYGFKYNRVAIRDQKTRWGSCSSRGNLNFNYKIIFLEDDLAEYIIVHELCHLVEMNHSSKFWDRVEKACPDYKSIRQRLKIINLRKLGQTV